MRHAKRPLQASDPRDARGPSVKIEDHCVKGTQGYQRMPSPCGARGTDTDAMLPALLQGAPVRGRLQVATVGLDIGCQTPRILGKTFSMNTPPVSNAFQERSVLHASHVST